MSARRPSEPTRPSSDTEQHYPKRRRRFKACLRCRQRKVKCPGGQPCSNCRRTDQECQYDNGAKKVFISEAYVKELESRSKRTPKATEPASPLAESVNTGDWTDENVANPLAHNPAGPTTDSEGGHHFVGPSSTWGFAWRSRRLLATLPFILNSNDGMDVDDAAHMQVNDPRCVDHQDARSLPRETIERYLSNFRYHVASIWYLSDLSVMNDIFDDVSGRGGANEYSRLLGHIQFNLVISIGKLLEHTTQHERSPGEAYFHFALSKMEMVNESKSIAREPVLVAQIHSLISFYFHAVNMRNDAYIHIGKAMRISFTQGLHRASIPIMLESGEQESRVRFWWSLYSLDMILTSLMGAPVSVHEDEITTRNPAPHPKHDSPEPLIYCMKAARLIAMVLVGIYGTKSYDRSLFVRSISKVLTGVEGLLNSIPVNLKVDFDRTTWHVSRTSATLYLLTYQILIVAVRPILFHLVELRVDSMSKHGASVALAVPSKNIKILLKKLVDAAVLSMRILSSLTYQSQLQTFLAFDVTATFSAAVVLSLVMFISSKPMNEVSYFKDALQILGELARNGNLSAQKREFELQSLQRVLNTALQDIPVASTLGSGEAEMSTQRLAGNDQPNMEVSDPALLAENLNFVNLNENDLIGTSWDDMASIQTFLDDDTTEGFEFYFAQIDQYPELIPVPDQQFL